MPPQERDRATGAKVPAGINGCAPQSKLFDGVGAEAVRISDESLSGSAAGVAFATCVFGSEAGAGIVGWRVLPRRLAQLRPGATLVLAIDSAHPFDDGVTAADARRRTLAVLPARLDNARFLLPVVGVPPDRADDIPELSFAPQLEEAP